MAGTTHARPGTLEVGTVLDGRYQVLASLASSPRRRVYRVRHVHIGTELVLRVLDFSGAADRVERFRKDSTAAGRLGHPNLVAVHDFGFAGGPKYPYLVTDPLEGAELSVVLADSGPMAAGEVLPLFDGCLEGLGRAHDVGLVHGGLRPESLFRLITDDGPRLVVVGFGQATPPLECPVEYLPPEVSSGDLATASSDVFQMALILGEMLTGSPMVPAGRSPGELELPLDLELLGLGALMDKALAVDPAARYADAGELLAALRELRSPPPQLMSAPSSGPAAAGPASKNTLFAGRPKIDAEAPDAEPEGRSTAVVVGASPEARGGPLAAQGSPAPTQGEGGGRRAAPWSGLLSWIQAHPALAMGGAVLWFVVTLGVLVWVVWPAERETTVVGAVLTDGDQVQGDEDGALDLEIAKWQAVLDRPVSKPAPAAVVAARAEAKGELRAYEAYREGLAGVGGTEPAEAYRLLNSIPVEHPIRRRERYLAAVTTLRERLVSDALRAAEHGMMIEDWSAARTNVDRVLELDPTSSQALELRSELDRRGRKPARKAKASSSARRRPATRSSGERRGGPGQAGGRRGGSKRRGGSSFFRPGR